MIEQSKISIRQLTTQLSAAQEAEATPKPMTPLLTARRKQEEKKLKKEEQQSSASTSASTLTQKLT